MPESVVYECSCPDYSAELSEILDKLDGLTALLGTIEGFMVFAVVVILCIFVYKFFRMFF